jgi:hypothetical protein
MTETTSINDKKERFKLIRISELPVSKSPAALIAGLIPREGLTVIWGPPKSGKSFVVMDAMLHVALGWDYRGRRVFRGPVVYSALEGAEGYGKRAGAFRAHHRRGCDHLGDGALDPPFFLVPARMNFSTDHGALVAAITAQIGLQWPVAVVIDTLNRSLHGSESNDADMSAYVRAADAVREAFNCAVVIVHHCGVNETRPRGHTSLTGAVDAQLACHRDPTSDNIVIEVEWMKDGPEGDKIVSRLQTVEIGKDDHGESITSCVVVSVDGPAQAAPRASVAARLPKAAQTTLRALREALNEFGVIPQASDHIPAGVCVVTVPQWRQYAYSMGISTGEDRAKQQAFKRASEHLIGGRHVGVWDNHVWLPATS